MHNKECKELILSIPIKHAPGSWWKLVLFFQTQPKKTGGFYHISRLRTKSFNFAFVKRVSRASCQLFYYSRLLYPVCSFSSSISSTKDMDSAGVKIIQVQQRLNNGWQFCRNHVTPDLRTETKYIIHAKCAVFMRIFPVTRQC